MNTLNNSEFCEICGNDANYKITNSTFRPVQCTEASLKNKDVINGFLYFATDSKKIYLGKDGKFLPMGGNSGIYYGNRIPEEGEADSEIEIFPFLNDIEIEGDQTPNINDLILNIPDGCFYRVTKYNLENNIILAEKLTIAGSGGGPSTGGGVKPSIMGLNENKTYYSLDQKELMQLTFTVNSKDSENNHVAFIEYHIGSNVIYDNETHEFGSTIVFKFDQYLQYLDTQGSNNISIIVQDNWENRSRPQQITIKIFDLKLNSSKAPIVSLFEEDVNSFIYPCIPSGGDDIGLTKYLEFSLAPLTDPNNTKVIKTESISSLDAQLPIGLKLKDLAEQYQINLVHGVYILTVQYCAYAEKEKILLTSNTLQHQLVYSTDTKIPLIASSFVDGTTITQYTEYVLKYLVSEGNENTDVIVEIYNDDKTINSPENIKLNEMAEWRHTFTSVGTHTLYIKYGNIVQKLGDLTITQYTDEKIPTIHTDLCELNLVATDKSNSQSNREEWSWKNGNKIYSAKFDNFLWGEENGWLPGPDGDPSLKLTNGAKLTIPNYTPFAKDPVHNGKLPGDGLTIEVDFMVSNVTDYNKPLISCLSRAYEKDDEGNLVVKHIETGFQITGQKATLNSQNYKATTQELNGEENNKGEISDTDIALSALIQHFDENTRIHLTYVIEPYGAKAGEDEKLYYFVYTYINGVLSGIMKLDESDRFLNSPGEDAIFTFDSTYGDIYVYAIRVCRQNLPLSYVIEHWMADINDISTKMALFRKNSILTNNRVNKNTIEQMSTSLGVPYIIFEGGIKMPKKFKKKNLQDPDNDIKDGGYHPNGYTFNDLGYKLPMTKEDYRLMSVNMYNKTENGIERLLSVPLELEDTTITVPEDAAEPNNIISDFNNITSSGKYWFNRGVQVYGQGTSSMVYPVKNLRLKFINKSDYPTVYEGSMPVEIVCLKADFMDSSSSHNTCTGNLVYDLYQSLGLKTPPQVFNANEKYDIVTAIRGFPVICFYKNYDPNEHGHNDEYVYIGRYNFNLDKATPEPFGFPAQYRETGKIVVDDQGRERKVVEVCGLATEKIGEDLVLPIDEEGNPIKIDIVQCWEFLNNDTNSPTKFLTPKKADGSRYTSYEAALRDVWHEYYEDRYPDEILGAYKDGELNEHPEYVQALEDGLFKMSLWVNSTSQDEARPGEMLPSEIYYKTLDLEPKKDSIYYNSNHQIVPLNLIDAIEIDVNNSIGETITRDKVIVNQNKFIQQVNNQYNTYTFSFNDNQWTRFDLIDENGNSLPIDLADYGITLTAIPTNGQTIFVDYFNDWDNWNPDQLYEKHTHDTGAYRLAKFKNEFTRYFNKEFSLFYYVLTLTLLMMDSRAKNMMLASWGPKEEWLTDGKGNLVLDENGEKIPGNYIWYPIFYDMDTMLGLNNTGFNKFSYDTEDDPADKVFNGFDSVLWNNFRECFAYEIAQFYVALRNDMSFDKLMETYNVKGADAWNEVLMTHDAIYKYERPYLKGYYDGKDKTFIDPGQISYLYAAQGRRSHHRAWWLRNRLGYLDSKYKPSSLGNNKPSQADTFSFRAYALPAQKSSKKAQECVKQTPANHIFDITALTNSYPSIFIGNIVYTPNDNPYVTAGSKVKIGPTQVKHEVESYILNPTLIADLGDLSDKYIGSWNMPANKLTALRFGRSSRSHPEKYNKYYNSLLTSLNIGNSTPYLNYLNIARCTGLPTLDISTCNKLEILDAEGATGMTAITFPQDSILKEVYLPRSLNSLAIQNQPHLEVLQFDPRVDRDLSFGSIELQNVNKVDTYPIIKEVFSSNNVSGTRYRLNNIKWVINDFTENKVTSIPILDILKNNQNKFIPLDGLTLSSAVSGTIIIEGTLDNPLEVNEFDLYRMYKGDFPNINIEFGNNVEVTHAIKVTFIKDNNNTIHYEVLTDAKALSPLSLDILVSSEGPNKVAMAIPYQSSTQAFDYNFKHLWVDENTGIQYYNDKTVPNDFEPPLNAVPFSEMYPSNNIILKALYEPVDRWYTVTFKDDNNNIISQEKDGINYSSWPVKYNSKYDGPIKNYHYKDESQLPFAKKYTFLGWCPIRNAIVPEFKDPNDLIVTSDITLYARFEEQEVHLTPARLEYFNISSNTITVKPEYKNILQGKITLPLMDSANKPILKIGTEAFKNMSDVTHIFFQQKGNVTNEYVEFGNGAFSIEDYASISNLKYVELPPKLTILGERVFKGCYSLEEIDLNRPIISIGKECFAAHLNQANRHPMKVSITALPETLQTLGDSAFWNAGPNISFTTIPVGVTEIPTVCFYKCSSVAIYDFGIDEGIGGLTTIGSGAFEETGTKIVSTGFTRVIFRKSVESIVFPNDSQGIASFKNSYLANSGMTVEIKNDSLLAKYQQVNQFTGNGIEKEPTVEGSVD